MRRRSLKTCTLIKRPSVIGGCFLHDLVSLNVTSLQTIDEHHYLGNRVAYEKSLAVWRYDISHTDGSCAQ